MPDPIFIIGSPRSGTSVLTWAIGQHPNISVQPESNWMPALADGASVAYRIGTSRGKFTQLSNAEMPFADFMAHLGNAIDSISRECYERRVELDSPGFRQRTEIAENAFADDKARLIRTSTEPKLRWVDGTPEYTFYTYVLGLFFPTCKFIHILRRPDQVVNSLAHFENLGHDTRNRDHASAIDIWTRHTLAARDTASYYGSDRLLRIDNADLVSDGQAVLARCFKFVGEPDCSYAVAPLNKRLNSSKAPEKQEETLRKIKDRPDFLAAQALYEELRDSAVPNQTDMSALDDQKQRLGQPKNRGLAAALPQSLPAKTNSLLRRLLAR